MAQTVWLRGQYQRDLAKDLIDKAPNDCMVKISLPTRTTDQNAKMWSMLSDISRAKPDGRCHPPETWKCLAMHACSYTVQFENGLNGQPFPVGYQSSKLTKEQMSDLIEFLYQYGAENGVRFTEGAIYE